MRNTSHKSNKNGGNDVLFMGEQSLGQKFTIFFGSIVKFFLYIKKSTKPPGHFFYAIMVCNSTTM